MMGKVEAAVNPEAVFEDRLGFLRVDWPFSGRTIAFRHYRGSKLFDYMARTV